MDGAGIITYPGYSYHGKFERNLPKGPGCFVFSEKYMQHGFYINLRDPAFDYVGAEELALDDNAGKGKIGKGSFEVLILLLLLQKKN